MRDVWHSADGVQWTLATNNPGWSGRYKHSVAVYDSRYACDVTSQLTVDMCVCVC